MSVRCVLARDDLADETTGHCEHTFVAVPAYGTTVSIAMNGRPEVFFVTGVMHCAAGSIPAVADPLVHLTISREPPRPRSA